MLIPKEQRAHILETPEDVCRATMAYMPLEIVEDWLLRSAPCDVLQDGRFGKVQVIRLGDVTDASVIEGKRQAALRVTDAIEATTDAVNALRGSR